MKKKIILFGNGDQASVVEDTLKKLNYIIHTKIYMKNNKLYDDKLKKAINEKFILTNYKKYNFHIAIGKLNQREIVFKKYKKNLKFLTIISKDSFVSKSCKIGSGTYISEGVIIKNNTFIGENSIINTGSIIEHHSNIGRNVHIAPGSVVCGHVEISDNVFIGAGSIIPNHIKINKKKFFKSGSVIKKST